MKKRNILFINILLYLALCVFGFFIYTRTNHIGIAQLIKNHNFVIGEVVAFGIPAVLSLICAIPLGRLGEKKSTKIDFAVIGVLLTVLFLVLGQFFYGLSKDSSSYSKLVKDYSLPILGNGLLVFAAFYSIVFAVRFVHTCVFKKNSEEEYKNHAKSIFAGLIILGTTCAILGVRLYIFRLGHNSYSQFANVGTKFYVIVTAFIACYLAIGIVLSVVCPKIITNIIYNVVALVAGLIIYFIMKNVDYTYFGKLSFYAALSASLIQFVLIAGSYIVKPCIDLIVGNGYIAKEEEVPAEEPTQEEVVEETPAQEETEEEVEYASKDSVDSLKQEVEDLKNNDEKSKYVYTLEDENKILRKRLQTIEDRLAALEASGVSGTVVKAQPHYETETVTVVRKGFKSRLINTENEGLKTVYQNIANLCNKYKKTKIRESFAKEVIHVGRNNVCILKMSTSGKAMYLYLALDKSYLEQTKYHLKDYSEKKAYAATPLRLRVSSNRSMQYATELLEIVLNNNAEKYVKERESIDLTKQLKKQSETEMLKNGLIKQHYVENTYLVEPVYDDSEDSTEEDDED